jgi:hypothetical protein
MARRLKFDEIGYWSEIKLDIVKDYASAYSRILAAQTKPALHHVYIDAFAGAGGHGAYGLGGSLFLNGANKSIGTGRNVVVLCSLEISRIVCRKRSCSAIGSLLIIAAACTIFSAA